MKRAASTIFLLIFTASVIGRTVERTEAWAAQHAHRPQLSSQNQAGTNISEERKQSPRQAQTKLIEDGSLLPPSFARSTNAPPLKTNLHHRLAGFVTDANDQTLSSRAPPSLS